MYRALIWKEWRETRFFLFIMATGTLLVSLVLRSLEQNDNDILAFLYVIIWLFFAVLLAASQFSNEAESGTLDFLLSRPTHWFKIWLVKTLWGICALTVFSFFLLLMGSFFIPSLTESATIIQNFFKNTPSSTPPVPFIGMSLFTIILSLYLIGCIVSTNIKASLKASLITFLVSGFLFFIMLYSSLLLNFTSSNYIFWIFLPLLFFVVFLKYHSYFYIRKVSYWILLIGGTFFWIIFALKGISLQILGTGVSHNYLFALSPSNVLFSFLLISFVISGILTSIFAFGIHQKKYPAWWKLISCFNLIILFTICTAAILLEIIPSQEFIRLETNSLSPIVISHHIYLKIPFLNRGKFPYMLDRVSYQYFIPNEDSGEVHYFGHGKFMFYDIHDVSTQSQWALYSCPALRWGVYYKWGLWAENLITNRQYLLMTRSNTPNMDDIEEEWFDKGSRLIIMDRDSNKKTLFSVKNGKPKKIKEEQEPGKSWLLHIDTNNSLYFYNTMNRIISCYNHELIKEYELSVVKDKMIEIISDYFQNEEPSQNKYITDIDLDNFTVGRDGRVKPSRDYNMPNIYFIGPIFSISPDGKYMIFYLSLNSKAGELKTDEPENWCISLPDGIYNKELKLRNSLYSYHWLPGTGRILDPYPKENKVDLIDLKKGISKNIIKGNFYRIQDKFPIEWSENGNYMLTYSFSDASNGRTVNLYRFDSDTLTCSLVSSKADLKKGNFELGDPERWSSDHSQVVFDNDSDNIWRLDLNQGKWSEIKCQFKDFRLLGISNKGEVYVAPLNGTKIYRITETDSKLIYDGK